MKICVIALNKKDYAPKRIVAEGKRRKHTMYLTKWDDIILEINSDRTYFGDKKESLGEFDAIITRNCKCIIRPKGKKVTLRRDTLLSLLVEYTKNNQSYFLNRGFLAGHQRLDKLAQQYFFFQNDLPGISSFYFTHQNKMRDAALNNFPIVAKIADSSLGAQVYKLNNKYELETFLADRRRDGEFFLLQKYYQIDRDYRVLVIGNKVLGIMERTSKKGEWRTNFSLGGTIKRAEENKQMKNLALTVARKMKLDYVGVDILKNKDELHLIEINPFAQFKGFEKAFPKVNVAQEIIKFVESRRK